MNTQEKHFNSIAKTYKKDQLHNGWYYTALKKLVQELCSYSSEKTVLDIGCGTGEMLAHIACLRGVGVDISQEMINEAKTRHSGLNRTFVKIEPYEPILMEYNPDIILAIDVIEHVDDFDKFVVQIDNICTKKTKLIITQINPIFSPLIDILDFLHLKIPEGEHQFKDKAYISSALKEYNLERFGCALPLGLVNYYVFSKR